MLQRKGIDGTAGGPVPRLEEQKAGRETFVEGSYLNDEATTDNQPRERLTRHKRVGLNPAGPGFNSCTCNCLIQEREAFLKQTHKESNASLSLNLSIAE